MSIFEMVEKISTLADAEEEQNGRTPIWEHLCAAAWELEQVLDYDDPAE